MENIEDVDPSKNNSSGHKWWNLGGILGYRVETIKAPLSGDKHRGRASIMLKPIATSDHAKLMQTAEMCPSNAIMVDKTRASIDMGKCILCGRCSEVSPGLFEGGTRFALPVVSRGDLVSVCNDDEMQPEAAKSTHEVLGTELKSEISRILGRSLAIREVDAGSCNGCEVEVNALNNPVYDVERFGIHFVSSPRHADVLLVTGPVSVNMEIALKRTYDATPDPKIVVAIGACGCSGGIFGESYATAGGVNKIVPVDVYVPGCPPRPEAILYGLLLAVSRIGKSAGNRLH